MKCFLEFHISRVWEDDDDDAEWTRKIPEGVKVELGKRDFTYEKDADFDDIQVICEADMRKEVVKVTRIGKHASTDSNLVEIGMGAAVEIANGQSFSLMGQDDNVFVRFQKEEDDTDYGEDEEDDTKNEVYFDGCFYDSKSHSLLREQQRQEDFDQILFNATNNIKS